jgi:DNA-binding Lrp family transcriptional regulator
MTPGGEHDLDARVVSLLEDGRPRTIAQAAAELATPPFAVRLALKRLHRVGRIARAGHLLEHRRTFGATAQHWAALWTANPGPPDLPGPSDSRVEPQASARSQ